MSQSRVLMIESVLVNRKLDGSLFAELKPK